jgi:hypothetical protein
MALEWLHRLEEVQGTHIYRQRIPVGWFIEIGSIKDIVAYL